ncbi:SLC13 family permease [Paenibacillus thiaminolyticus]|uniref:SLC13 family permease n=1 Tax=Paenibacillus thiaminolyticus TaxID=49283 RepID=UPI0035A7321E
MKISKQQIGLVLGILIAIIVAYIPLAGLSHEGQICLALTLMTVVFWAFQIAQPGYVAGVYLALLVIFQVAKPDVVFSPWVGTTMYLVIGAYLIAGAVKSSGFGERIAYSFILKFVKGYKSIIVSIFILTFVLSILIPHPWPRAFLIMSVIAVVITSANLSKADAAKIGFTVFASSVPVSLIFLTGDSVINPLAVEASGQSISWLQWFVYMGVPNIISSILTCLLILVLFKPSSVFIIDKEEIRAKLKSMGKLTQTEIRTIIWLVIAIVLWMTDSIHGIDIGWITLIIAMLMSFPIIGKVLTPKNWADVPMHVLIFLTAAISIGRVGAVTGMNTWLADTILPSTVSSNIFLLALFITVIAIVIHMVLGSVIAVMGIVIPAILIFTEPMGLNPIVPTLIVYTAIALHYIFPFHHLNILVGQGEENGMYSQKEVLRLGIPLTVVVFIIILLIEIPWWKMIGLL